MPGQAAQITYFGGERVSAHVVAVRDGGRRLQVQADSGESLTFALNAATAQFVEDGEPHGARLVLHAE